MRGDDERAWWWVGDARVGLGWGRRRAMIAKDGHTQGAALGPVGSSASGRRGVVRVRTP